MLMLIGLAPRLCHGADLFLFGVRSRAATLTLIMMLLPLMPRSPGRVAAHYAPPLIPDMSVKARTRTQATLVPSLMLMLVTLPVLVLVLLKCPNAAVLQLQIPQITVRMLLVVGLRSLLLHPPVSRTMLPEKDGQGASHPQSAQSVQVDPDPAVAGQTLCAPGFQENPTLIYRKLLEPPSDLRRSPRPISGVPT